MMQRTSFVDVKNMSENEKRLLFGEPPKLEYQQTKTKRVETLTKETIQKDQSLDPRFSDLTNSNVPKRKECFLQRFVISVNNTYKSIWDIFILFLIGYSCITSAY